MVLFRSLIACVGSGVVPSEAMCALSCNIDASPRYAPHIIIDMRVEVVK